jgi:hypothetical protein
MTASGSPSRRPANTPVQELLRRTAGRELEPDQAALGEHEDRVAERRRVDAPAQHHPGALGAVLAGRHRLQLDEQVMQPRRPGEPDVEGGAEHVARCPEPRLGRLDREQAQELLGADTGPAGEDALGMPWAQPHHPGDRLEIRLRLLLTIEEADRPLHAVPIPRGLQLHRGGILMARQAPGCRAPPAAATPESCASPARLSSGAR